MMRSSVRSRLAPPNLSITCRRKAWQKVELRSLIEADVRSRNDLVERGFSRQPLRIDLDVAHTLEILAHAAWSLPRDKYYDGGDRYRSLNRLHAEIVEGGVKVWPIEESTPYVQLKKYNTTLGGQPREYAALPLAIRRIRRRSQDNFLSPIPAALADRYEVFS